MSIRCRDCRCEIREERDECDICLDDAEISRQHALIEIRGTDATLQDLGSTNGTHIDGSRVTQASLQNCSEFRIGNQELMFEVTERELDLV
jgi:pSer/pThr/pTyr-binding forkhead associated (FHA) protein